MDHNLLSIWNLLNIRYKMDKQATIEKWKKQRFLVKIQIYLDIHNAYYVNFVDILWSMQAWHLAVLLMVALTALSILLKSFKIHFWIYQWIFHNMIFKKFKYCLENVLCVWNINWALIKFWLIVRFKMLFAGLKDKEHSGRKSKRLK